MTRATREPRHRPRKYRLPPETRLIIACLKDHRSRLDAVIDALAEAGAAIQDARESLAWFRAPEEDAATLTVHDAAIALRKTAEDLRYAAEHSIGQNVRDFLLHRAPWVCPVCGQMEE